jgi:hypothetical protein
MKRGPPRNWMVSLFKADILLPKHGRITVAIYEMKLKS